MRGNPCLHASRKSTFEGLDSPSDRCRLSCGCSTDTTIWHLIGAMWSNGRRKHGSYVIEKYGRPVRTRTADLYRVKVAL
jgi:hypothetical protein